MAIWLRFGWLPRFLSLVRAILLSSSLKTTGKGEIANPKVDLDIFEADFCGAEPHYCTHDRSRKIPPPLRFKTTGPIELKFGILTPMDQTKGANCIQLDPTTGS